MSLTAETLTALHRRIVARQPHGFPIWRHLAFEAGDRPQAGPAVPEIRSDGVDLARLGVDRSVVAALEAWFAGLAPSGTRIARLQLTLPCRALPAPDLARLRDVAAGLQVLRPDDWSRDGRPIPDVRIMCWTGQACILGTDLPRRSPGVIILREAASRLLFPRDLRAVRRLEPAFPPADPATGHDAMAAVAGLDRRLGELLTPARAALARRRLGL